MLTLDSFIFRHILKGCLDKEFAKVKEAFFALYAKEIDAAAEWIRLDTQALKNAIEKSVKQYVLSKFLYRRDFYTVLRPYMDLLFFQREPSIELSQSEEGRVEHIQQTSFVVQEVQTQDAGVLQESKVSQEQNAPQETTVPQEQAAPQEPSQVSRVLQEPALPHEDPNQVRQDHKVPQEKKQGREIREMVRYTSEYIDMFDLPLPTGIAAIIEEYAVAPRGMDMDLSASPNPLLLIAENATKELYQLHHQMIYSLIVRPRMDLSSKQSLFDAILQMPMEAPTKSPLVFSFQKEKEKPKKKDEPGPQGDRP